MSLTITIPGAVDVTTGSTAPAVLTIGVGVPGAAGPQGPAGPGVPVGGTSGQYLQKTSGADYATDWVTVNLAAYAVKANNLSDLTSASTARTNLGLGTMATATAADYSTTTAANALYYPLSSNPASYLTASALTPYLTSSTASATYQTLAGMSSYLTTSAAAAGYYPLSGNPSGFLTSSALTGYATQSFVASNYAPIAAGQPTSGTVGQVLTKQSGTDYDASWATLIPGDRYLTTSTTSLTINNANKTLTIGTGLSYSSQQDVVIAHNASNHMHARVLTYDSGTGVMDVDVLSHSGSGTYATWTVNVGGAPALASVVWGEILGTLGDQSDLSTALSSKLESATAATTYAALAGATFSGEVITPASTTSNAGLTITPGTAPTSPTDGEIWATTSDLQIRLNGVTETLAEQSWVTSQGYLTSSALTPYAPLAGSTFTGKVTTVAPTTTVAGLNLPHGTAPTTPVDGDLWTTTSGLFARINNGTQQYPALGLNNTFTSPSSTYGSSTATGAIGLASGATISGSTKTVNVATGGVAGSTTFTNIGPVLGASTTSIGATTAASTLNLATGATLTATTKAVNIGTSGVAGSTTNIAIGSTTGTSTTTLQGITNGVTAAADTNSVALATTAYVVGQAGSAAPLVNGTAAVGTSLRYARQDHVHPTDTSRAALASPTFTGVPAAPTAAVDTNTTQLATTAFVVAQAAAATPLVDGTAAVGTSTRYARADHVHPTDTTRAPLASPALTGTPTAPTATAGTNTTQLATTAFVTAAVPAFGATADVNEPLSTTKAASIDNVREMLMSPAHQIFYQGAGVSGTSGAGSAVNLNSGRWKEYVSPNATVAGYGIGVFDTTAANIGFAGYTRGQNLTTRNWSKKVWLSGRCMIGHFSLTSYDGSANTFARISLGGFNVIQSGDMVAGIKGIGWRVQGGGSQALTLQVSNGTTVTNVTSSFTPVTKQVFDWEIYSDGAGNVTLFVNDSQVATTAAGPTGTAATGLYMEGVDTTASSTAPFILNNLGTKIFFGI